MSYININEKMMIADRSSSSQGLQTMPVYSNANFENNIPVIHFVDDKILLIMMP